MMATTYALFNTLYNRWDVNAILGAVFYHLLTAIIMSLTKKEAIDFSIKKWKAIVANDGDDLTKEEKQKLGIYLYNASCGLCEKYHNYLEHCVNCPFSNGFDKGCSHSEHPWYNWFMTKTKEAAQIVLDELIKLKNI